MQPGWHGRQQAGLEYFSDTYAERAQDHGKKTRSQVALYRKDWELGRRRRAYMAPLWAAAGWQRDEPVTRCEVRLRR